LFSGALVSFSKIGGQWSEQQYLVGHDASYNHYFIGGTNYYRYANMGYYGFAYSDNTAVSVTNNYGTQIDTLLLPSLPFPPSIVTRICCSPLL
jgi:hypothetical protein